jgi:multidrug efflux pump subunit AcrB
VPSSSVGEVRLDNVASLVHGVGPVQIDRQNRQRQIALMFSLAPGAAMNRVITQLRERAKTVAGGEPPRPRVTSPLLRDG